MRWKDEGRMKVRETYLDVTLGLLCLGRQEVSVSVHRNSGVATLGPYLLGAGADPELPEELPGGGEDDDPGVRHDDLALGSDTHRGQLLELSRLLASGPDLLLEFAAGLEHQDAAHTVVRDEHLVLVVNSHGNRLNQIVV